MTWLSGLPGWLWAIPGIGAAVLGYVAASKIAGRRVGIFAAIGILAVAAFKVATATARQYGRAEMREAQQRRHDEDVARIEAARRAEQDRQAREGHGRGPADDPNRRPHRLPDDPGTG